MRDGWEMVKLGDVALVNPKVSGVCSDTPFITMSDVPEWGRTARPSGPRGTRGGTRAHGGDVLVARITPCLENGKIAMVSDDYEVVGGSTEFIVLRGGKSVLSEYLFCWAQSMETHSAAIKLMIGTTGRQRVSASDFSSLPILLPPLHEQHRIVDLIAAVDDAIEAASANSKATETALTAALSASVDLGGGCSHLADMFNFMLGGAWGSAPGVEDQQVLAIGPSAYRSKDTFVDPVLGTARSLSPKRAQDRSLRIGDIVLERSGGSPTQPVGRVIRMENEHPWVVPSDFMRILRVDEAVANRDFAFWVLWLSYRTRLPVPYQKRTTSIFNLNIPDYLSGVRIQLPPMATQARIAELGERGWANVIAARAHADSLRNLRSNLLTTLLSGEHEIPTSYDKFL